MEQANLVKEEKKRGDSAESVTRFGSRIFFGRDTSTFKRSTYLSLS